MKNSTLLMAVGILAAVAMISTAVSAISMQAEAAKPDKNKGGGGGISSSVTQINICGGGVVDFTTCDNVAVVDLDIVG